MIKIMVGPVPANRWPLLFCLLALVTVGAAHGGEEESMDRRMVHEVIVTASLDDVWHAWTTTEGVNSFFTPYAKVELKVDGFYEMYFDMNAEPGLRGGEGCRVLSYLPNEMLSYSWNAPPSIPNLRKAGTQTLVVMQFAALGDGTVRITHTMLEIGQGDDWDKYYAYFESAWTHVLENCRQRFTEGPMDWSN